MWPEMGDGQGVGCSAQGLVLYALRWHTQLCKFVTCHETWAPAACSLKRHEQQRLRDQLPEQVAQISSLGDRAQWGRSHVRVRVPLTEQWTELFGDQVGGSDYPSTDIVIARCTEPVAGWLPGLLVHFPAHARLRVFLYETCSSPSRREAARKWAQPWAFWFDVPVMRQPVENRGFESAVYLRHMVQAVEHDDVAETTLFLQAGWQEHTRKLLACDWLEQFIAGAPFIQYGARYSTVEGNGCWDVCMSHHVWAVALPGHDPLKAASASYAIFHAHRDRITARGLDALRVALDVATMRSPDLIARLCGPSLPFCPGHGCQKRLSKEDGFARTRLYCNDSGKLAGIGLELGWHVLLGEPDALPLDRAPLSDVASSFYPPKGGPWRPPLSTPCGLSGVWDGGQNNTRMTTRLKRILLRLVSSGGLVLASVNNSVLGRAGRNILRFASHNRTLGRTSKRRSPQRKLPLLHWENEETHLLSTMTGWHPNAEAASTWPSARPDRDRPLTKRKASLPIAGAANATGNAADRGASRASHPPCCRWAPPNERQPRHTTCGEPDEPNPGWWRSLPTNRTRQVLLVRMNHGSAGFFAYVLFALNQLIFAVQWGLVPYIDFGKCTVNGHDHYASGGANLYYDPASGPNMWEYYFEPVSSYRLGSSNFETHALPSKLIWRLHHKEANSVFAYYYGVHASKRGYDEAWYRTMRTRASQLLGRFVRPRQHLLKAVDEYWSSHFGPGANVLGVHMRGTDKQADIGGNIVPPQLYMHHIDIYLQQHPNARVFLATDSPRFLRRMRERYSTKLVARNALRSERNAFLDVQFAGTNERKGFDVLIDALLLSRCAFLLKSSSAVGEFAIYFNMSLHSRSIDLQYVGINRSSGHEPPRSDDIAADSGGQHGLRSATCTAGKVLALHTDLCSSFVRCPEQRASTPETCAVTKPTLRRAQALYGAFRLAYQNLLSVSVRRRPDLAGVEPRTTLHSSRAVDLVVSRCGEPVLDFFLNLLPYLAESVRLVVQERCVDHTGSKPSPWPSIDVRDELLGIQRVAVAQDSTPCAAHAEWADRAQLGRAPVTMCLHARGLFKLTESHVSLSCMAKALFAASAGGGFQDLAGIARPILSANNGADEVTWSFARFPANVSIPKAHPSDGVSTFVASRADLLAHCSLIEGRALEPLVPSDAIKSLVGRLMTSVDGVLSASSVPGTTGVGTATHVPKTTMAIQAAATCSEPNFMLYNREFWPDEAYDSMRACSWGAEERHLAVRLQHSQGLSHLRHRGRRTCRGEGIVETTLLPAGWWSTVLGTLKPLGHAVRTGRTMLTPRIPAFVDPNLCPQVDLSCFFLPLAPTCDGIYQRSSVAFVEIKPASQLRRSWLEWAAPWLRFATQPSANLGSQLKHSSLPPMLDLHDNAFVQAESVASIPSPYRQRGWFWWTSQLLLYATRPSPLLQHDVARKAEQSGLSGALASGVRVIGVHIRHGDSCSTRERRRMARTCAPLEDYLEHVRALAGRLDTTTIFLATDDASVLEVARTLPNLTVLAVPHISRFEAEGARPELWDKLVSRRAASQLNHLNQQEAWDATIDAMLLAQCDALIGKFTSTLFRTAMSLRSASCSCIPPFVSLDAAWCFDYGLKAGSNWEFPLASTHKSIGKAENRFWC